MKSRHQKDLLGRLRQAVRATGKTNYAVAKGAGVDQSVMGKFMTRRTAITVTNAERLMDYLGFQIIDPPAAKRRAKRSK